MLGEAEPHASPSLRHTEAMRRRRSERRLGGPETGRASLAEAYQREPAPGYMVAANKAARGTRCIISCEILMRDVVFLPYHFCCQVWKLLLHPHG